MKAISARVVELTETEDRCADLFYDYLDEGKPIHGAAWLALRNVEKEGNITFGDDFIEWLSEGTVKRGPSGKCIFNRA